MTVNLQQFERGITNFIDIEIGRKATGGNKFLTYFIMPLLPKKIEKEFNNLKDNVIFSDFLDENGNIKIDDLYNNSKQAIQKSGTIELYGVIFNESDIDKLYNYIINKN